MASLYFSLIKYNCQHKHTRYEQSHNKNQQKQLCILENKLEELLNPAVGLMGNVGQRCANSVCVCACVWFNCPDSSTHRSAKAAKCRLFIQCVPNYA